ncbi:DNA-binding LytR/AlgR family response regulator [Novosphingobium chloroacetimidivorans]|uniref:DNA-binding LytR/AlgR family response regulator n=1 Tax=Novosphingobium chloroacetimidivorans TaxID=1428314 RepID=A0A7W7K994_9SPHN|nr:response regulator [Novosphingobium chloroacetimidivorans]MBB4858597.1 DNA-binding LytR/AlgR family response regulator [Novosphingobium chloroacetimidivorans]
MIVEDEFLVALQLEDIILDCGYEVVATVPDMASCSAICDAPAVALVDLNLRDGPTGPLIAKMLSERYGTRIIYVTANSGQIGDPAETALGVVHKPFSRAAIEDAIAYALDETRTLRRPFELQQIEQVAFARVA